MAEKLIHVGLDLDEVTFDYVGGIRKYAASEEGLILPADEPSHFSMTESGWFPTMDDFKELHGRAVLKNLYEDLEVLPGATKALRDMKRCGYVLNVMTSRFVVRGQHSTVLTQTANALDKAKIPYSSISFLSEKWRNLQDVYIDDAPHNLIPLQEHGRYTVAFDRLWNREVPGDRVKNWEDLRELMFEKFGK